VRTAVLILLIIGGLNWLLYGLFQWDLVGGLLGGMTSWWARAVYVLVGLAALYAFSFLAEEPRERREEGRHAAGTA